MEKQTYKEMQQQVAKLNKNIEIMDAVIKAGIPQSKAHYIFDFVGNMFSVSSGYSMGETVDIEVIGERVIRIDQEKEYARTCKWNANHGMVIIELTKKDFRWMFDQAARLDEIHYGLKFAEKDVVKTRYREELIEIHKEIREFVGNRVSERSVIKKNATVIKKNATVIY